MATTGELRTIIQELHLVDVGDAATYFGEEAFVEEELAVPNESDLMLAANTALTATCDGFSCRFTHA